MDGRITVVAVGTTAGGIFETVEIGVRTTDRVVTDLEGSGGRSPVAFTGDLPLPGTGTVYLEENGTLVATYDIPGSFLIRQQLRFRFGDQEGSFELRQWPFGFAPGQTDFWVLDAALRYRLPRRFGFISVGVNNATDEEFSYLATESILPSNARTLSLRPGRVYYARVVLAFP